MVARILKMSKGWDNATLKKLKTLNDKGLSTSEIGKRLGMSKNAVVGKLNRLGWNATAGSKTKAPASKKTAAPAKKTTTKVAPKKATPVKKPVAKAKPVAKKTATPAKEKPAPKPVVKPTKKTASTPATKEKKTVSSSSKSASSKNLAMHQRIIQHSLEMANLKPNQCRWPIGDPDSENFHFCGKQVFTGKPYCYEHCRLAYQFTPPKKK